uniref:C-type lectin domain-containing protein n=2 Tax=Magallana gigas TaxID=29159 RepID=A0A8W8M9V1_MAGGI
MCYTCNNKYLFTGHSTRFNMTGLYAVLGLVAFIMIDTSSARSKYRIVEYNSKVTSWEEARDACRRSEGWDLAKIENRQENEALKYLLATECNNGGDGWFIGGKSENGVWKWADNSDMLFNNFPPVRTSINEARPTSTVINYAVIFKGDYQWGYVAPRPTPRMGYVCENMTC